MNEWYLVSEESRAYHESTEPSQISGERWSSQSGLFRSDGGRDPNIRFSADGNLLFCEGFCIGNIDGVAAEFSPVTVANALDINAPPVRYVSLTPDRVLQPKTTDRHPYGSDAALINALGSRVSNKSVKSVIS
jgi:hypothetical protein